MTTGGIKFQKQTPGTLPGTVTDTNSGWDQIMPPGPTNVAIDFSSPGPCSVSVTAIFPIGSIASNCIPTDTLPFVIPACDCPKPLDPKDSLNEWAITPAKRPNNSDPRKFEVTNACDSASVTLALKVDRGQFPDSDIEYSWNFGDGTSLVTSMGPSGATQSHTFNNTAPGTDETYTVTVTVSVPSSPNCTPFSVLSNVTVLGCKTATPTTTPSQGGDGKPTKFCVPCFALLVTAVALIVIGGILLAINCVILAGGGIPPPYLFVIAVIVLALGWVLYGLWYLFCSRLTECAVINTVLKILAGLLALLAIVNIILAFTNPPLAKCIALFVTTNFTAINSALFFYALARGCLRQNN